MTKKFSVTYMTIMGAERTITVTAKSFTDAMFKARDKVKRSKRNSWGFGLQIHEKASGTKRGVLS